MNLRYLLFLIIVFFGLNGYSQISSEADFNEATEYSDSDYVFVFCTDDVNGGSLTVKDSTGNGGYDFAWYKFSEGDEDFTDVLGSGNVESGDSISTITGLSRGGYMVTLTNVVPAQTYVAWVYIGDELTADLRFDASNECDYLGIWVDPVYTTTTYFNTSFSYFDSLNAEYSVFKNKVDLYEWSHDNSDWLGFISYNAPFTSMFDLPTKNTIFSIVTTDRFGCQIEDDIDYTAIETRAKLLWQSMDERTEELLESGNNDNEITGPAPLLAKFTNDSENGQNYTWFFGDTLWNNDVDTIVTSDFLLEPEHTYYYTADTGKTYTLKLISESEYGCKDSITLEINIEPSVIEFPNVFTPNDDGTNDVFVLTDYQSIRIFKITIFNRVGQLAHEFEGDVRDWEGWNGKIKDSSSDAPEGNYFFVVEVKGWDNVEYNNNTFKKASAKENSTTTEETTETSGSGQFGILRLYR
ncbi:MAG: gliding motility-associated C-terminal domain-containing protein [Bacteroidales bacterium]|nr:gliding motility-associated C-terminal domain-containing protein [Bacteroidales bacterium]